MPLFENCCPNSPIHRKKSAAYVPSSLQNGRNQNNCESLSPSTSAEAPIKVKIGCSDHSIQTTSENEKGVQFNEGVMTGSTEMLNAVNFYQDCVDQETENQWMEIYEEHKAIGQAVSSPSHSAADNGQINPRDSSLARSCTVTNSHIDISNTAAPLEKTHSVGITIERDFESHLQRCQEMENIAGIENGGREIHPMN